jgi:hypothetical protein
MFIRKLIGIFNLEMLGSTASYIEGKNRFPDGLKNGYRNKIGTGQRSGIGKKTIFDYIAPGNSAASLGVGATSSINLRALAALATAGTTTFLDASGLGAGYMDVPRTVQLAAGAGVGDGTLTGASAKAILVTGLDAIGNTIKETVPLNGVTAVNSVKCFNKVTRIDPALYFVGGTDDCSLGYGASLGLSRPLESTSDLLEFETRPTQKFKSSSIADSSAITGTSVETAFNVTATLPANFWRPGGRVRITGFVVATSTNGSDTLLIKLKLGSTVLLANVATDATNGDVVFFDFTVQCRTIGASGTIIGWGITNNSGASGVAAGVPVTLNSTAIDTTATGAITVTATWSSSSGSNSCLLRALTVSSDEDKTATLPTSDVGSAHTTIATALTASATSIVVADGSGFPNSTQRTMVEIISPDGSVEEVIIRSRSSNTLTVVRGVNGATARSWPVGSVICWRPGMSITPTIVANERYLISYRTDID